MFSDVGWDNSGLNLVKFPLHHNITTEVFCLIYECYIYVIYMYDSCLKEVLIGMHWVCFT